MVSKETIELAYLVAIQRLVPLQRAVLILRDVLDCSAKEAADVLETSVPAVNSALQRARSAMKEHLPERRTEWAAGTDVTAAERELLERYVEHSKTPDPHALKRLLSEGVRFSMPPEPGVWEGRDTVVQSWVDGGFGTGTLGSLQCVVTGANRQPAVACYARRPGDERYSPLAIDVAVHRRRRRRRDRHLRRIAVSLVRAPGDALARDRAGARGLGGRRRGSSGSSALRVPRGLAGRGFGVRVLAARLGCPL